MTALSLVEIRKRAGRIETLLSKLSNKSPFILTDNTKFEANRLYEYNGKNLINTYDPSKKVEYILAQKVLNDSKYQFFIGKDGTTKYISLTKIQKTSEFGGSGSSTIKEDAALLQLREAIYNAVKVNKGPIQITIDNKTYKNIVDVVSTSGTPKSDFHIIDNTGKAVIWISHKDGKTPKDFQQWGGISEKREPTIFKHKETQQFINDIKKEYPNGLPPATSLYRKIKDKDLKMLSVYGNKYNISVLGEQNVSILLQGSVGLIKSGQTYKLTAVHVHINGQSVDSDGYEPVFMAIYKGDRSDAGIRGTRVVIMPILGRKAIEFLGK